MTQTIVPENLRPIGLEELSDIANELRTLAVWAEYRKLAVDLFGPEAAYLTFSIEGEYNDEGGTAYYIRNFEVLDADRQPMRTRMDAPEWIDVFKNMTLDPTTADDADPEYIEEYDNPRYAYVDRATGQEVDHYAWGRPATDVDYKQVGTEHVVRRWTLSDILEENMSELFADGPRPSDYDDPAFPSDEFDLRTEPPRTFGQVYLST